MLTRKLRSPGSDQDPHLLITMKPSLVALVLTLTFDGKTRAQLCEEWCTELCTMLNGDVEYECGACDANDSRFRCKPGAIGFGPKSEEMRAAARTAAVEAKVPKQQVGDVKNGWETRYTSKKEEDLSETDRLWKDVPGAQARVSSTVAGEEVVCALPRVDGSYLRSLPLKTRQKLLRRPTIVTNLIDDWPAVRRAPHAIPVRHHRRASE